MLGTPIAVHVTCLLSLLLCKASLEVYAEVPQNLEEIRKMYPQLRDLHRSTIEPAVPLHVDMPTSSTSFSWASSMVLQPSAY